MHSLKKYIGTDNAVVYSNVQDQDRLETFLSMFPSFLGPCVRNSKQIMINLSIQSPGTELLRGVKGDGSSSAEINPRG